MKLRTLLPLSCLLLASVALAGSLPLLDVSVSNAGGKTVFKGATKADGTFATGKLAPGNYVVQFTSKGAVQGGPYALEASVGKVQMMADSLPGSRFSDPGVAMRVNVASAMPMTGRVAKAGTIAKASAPANGKAKDTRQVKMINGKPYVWVIPQTSSLEGGHWVEQGSKDDPMAGGEKK